jgi:hypothetical protein
MTEKKKRPPMAARRPRSAPKVEVPVPPTSPTEPAPKRTRKSKVAPPPPETTITPEEAKRLKEDAERARIVAGANEEDAERYRALSASPSRLTDMMDDRGQQEITDIVQRIEHDGLSYDDALKLLVRSMVDQNLDPRTVGAHVREAMRQQANVSEVLMVSQALKYLAGEYDMARMIDSLAIEMQVIARTESDTRVKVSAFNALRGWRTTRGSLIGCPRCSVA